MIGHLRVKSPWSQLGIFLGLFGIIFIFGTLLMGLLMLAMGVPIAELGKMDWGKPKLLSIMKLVQALSSVLLFLLPAFLYSLITFRSRPFYFLGAKKAERGSFYLLAVIAIIVAFPLVVWLGDVNQMIPLPQWMTNLEKDATKQMEAFLKAENFKDVVLNVIIIALLPAICEEICFRGALQRILINMTRSPWTGIIIASIVFSGLHFQFQGFLPRMFLGILLGAIYWYSGSIWPGVAAHFVNNAAQVVAVSYFPEYIAKNPEMPLIIAPISAVLTWLALWRLKSTSTASYEKVYGYEELNRTNEFIA
jgi:membrane protease YdiL (CAAX protease family)